MKLLHKQHIFKTIVLTLIVLLSSYAMYLYFEAPHITMDGEAEATFTSNKLLTEVSTNQGEELKKYIEKKIEIEGVLKEITQREKTYTLILSGSLSDAYIICEMQPGEALKIQKLRLGQNVKIKGIYKGLLKDVILLNCILV